MTLLDTLRAIVDAKLCYSASVEFKGAEPARGHVSLVPQAKAGAVCDLLASAGATFPAGRVARSTVRHTGTYWIDADLEGVRVTVSIEADVLNALPPLEV